MIAVGQALLPGALTALDRLRRAGLPVRLITNTTRQSRHALQTQLDSWNLGTAPDALFTPATAAALICSRMALSLTFWSIPLEPEFDELPTGGPMAVVVGDAGDAFTYGALNDAFRRLVDGAEFLALARNRMFTEPDGASLDAGPFVVALEYACARALACSASPLPPSSWKHSTAWGCPRPTSL